MVYIQRKDGVNQLETVDQFENYQEAKKMLREYQLSDIEAGYYLSNRACKAWRDSK